MKKGDLYKMPSSLFFPSEIGIFTNKHWCESSDGWLYNFYFPASGIDFWYTEAELCYATKLKMEQE